MKGLGDVWFLLKYVKEKPQTWRRFLLIAVECNPQKLQSRAFFNLRWCRGRGSRTGVWEFKWEGFLVRPGGFQILLA